MKNKRLRNVIFTGLLVAVGIVLSQFLSIAYPPTQTIIKFGIGYLPLIIISIMFGPELGALAGITQDIVGYFLFGASTGPFFPGFTFNAILFGVVPGLIYRVKNDKFNIFKIINFSLLGILFISGIYFLFDISAISNKTDLSDAVRYIVVVSGLVSILVISYFVWTKRKRTDEVQKIIFIVIILNLVVSILLTPTWVSILYKIPFWPQIPLRIVKLPIEIFIYSLIMIEINNLIKSLRNRNN